MSSTRYGGSRSALDSESNEAGRGICPHLLTCSTFPHNEVLLLKPGQANGRINDQQRVSSIADEIMRFKYMLDDGMISDAEFQEMKSKLLSRGNNF